MALVTPIPTPYGIDATYHRVATIQVYFAEQLVDVVFASYLDAEARANGKTPLGNLPGLRFSFQELGLEALAEPCRADIYAAVKRVAAAGENPALAPFASADDA